MKMLKQPTKLRKNIYIENNKMKESTSPFLNGCVISYIHTSKVGEKEFDKVKSNLSFTFVVTTIATHNLSS